MVRHRPTWPGALMLLALLWQALAIQAHVHVRQSTTVAANKAVVRAPAPSAGDDPATCPLCRELAHAGRYLPAAPPVWRVPSAVRQWRPHANIRRWRLRKRSHAWHSRGPPARIA